MPFFLCVFCMFWSSYSTRTDLHKPIYFYAFSRDLRNCGLQLGFCGPFSFVLICWPFSVGLPWTTSQDSPRAAAHSNKRYKDTRRVECIWIANHHRRHHHHHSGSEWVEADLSKMPVTFAELLIFISHSFFSLLFADRYLLAGKPPSHHPPSTFPQPQSIIRVMHDFCRNRMKWLRPPL